MPRPTCIKLLTAALALLICAMTFGEDVKLSLVPSFNSCGVYFKEDAAPDAKRVAEYRKSGSGKWLESYPLVYDETDRESRGSIVNLAEDSEYELKVSQDIKRFRTWSPHPKIAKTISLDKMELKGQLLITESGAEDGWIRYTAPKGFVLKGAPDKDSAVLLDGAKFIILENLTISGGAWSAVHVRNCENIRLLNCDISGWGPVGVQDFRRGANYFLPNGRILGALACGVNIDNTLNLVVERCYIHDPNGRANSWRFSHPCGPTAIYVRSRGGTVLRYNDMIGSDPHRWDDVIEGWGNSSPQGSFHRDADICGNMLAFANDDGIELDGGQMNTRFYRNKIEGCLCGISTAPCFLGPSYIFENLIVNLAEDSGIAGVGLKNNSGWHGRGQLLYFNNTIAMDKGGGVFSPYIGIDTPSPFAGLLKGTMRNNLFLTNAKPIAFAVFNQKNDFDGDLLFSSNPSANAPLKAKLDEMKLERNGIFSNPEFIDAANGDFRLRKGGPGSGRRTPVQGFVSAPGDVGAFESASATALPFRPLPVSVDRQQIDFVRAANGGFRPQQFTAGATANDFKGEFEIRKNYALAIHSRRHGQRFQRRVRDSQELRLRLVRGRAFVRDSRRRRPGQVHRQDHSRQA